MKKFIKKLLFFLIPVGLIFYIKPLYLLQNGRYKNRVNGSEIYHSIKRSKQRSDEKTLLLGDSVALQLFGSGEDHNGICSLVCNQAIGVIGQYFLLNNCVEAESRPDEVFLIYTPFSLQNNLDSSYTYHYFLKPFYNEEYLALFTETAVTQTDKIPFSGFCREPNILTSNWAPKFKPKGQREYTFLSPISREYIEKIKTLCLENGIRFYIVPTPTKESAKAMIQEFSRAEIEGVIAEDELLCFLDHIQYFPDAYFFDKVHLRSPDRVRERVLLNMQKVREAGDRLHPDEKK